MKMFRVVFARNEIISCNEICLPTVRDIPHYEADNGNLIFAILKEESEEKARARASELVKEVKS
jgi:hypothetical protein